MVVFIHVVMLMLGANGNSSRRPWARQLASHEKSTGLNVSLCSASGFWSVESPSDNIFASSLSRLRLPENVTAIVGPPGMTFVSSSSLNPGQVSYEPCLNDKSSHPSFGACQCVEHSSLLLSAMPTSCPCPDSISWPNVTTIGSCAFDSCWPSGMTSLPSGLTSIGASAFGRSCSLAVTSLPPGLTSIGDFAFYGCTSLALTSLPSSVTSIGHGAFYGCTSLALTSLPSSVTSIGEAAFSGCTSLALTILPSSVTSIGEQAFYGCTSLALTSLPPGLTSIERSTFEMWPFGSPFYSALPSLALTSLPSSVTSIGELAFSGCTSLALTSLPSSVTSIGDRAFYDCTSLALTSLPPGLTSINRSAFEMCTSITSLSIPSAVAELGEGAFRARGLYGAPRRLAHDAPRRLDLGNMRGTILLSWGVSLNLGAFEGQPNLTLLIPEIFIGVPVVQCLLLAVIISDCRHQSTRQAWRALLKQLRRAWAVHSRGAGSLPQGVIVVTAKAIAYAVSAAMGGLVLGLVAPHHNVVFAFVMVPLVAFFALRHSHVPFASEYQAYHGTGYHHFMLGHPYWKLSIYQLQVALYIALMPSVHVLLRRILPAWVKAKLSRNPTSVDREADVQKLDLYVPGKAEPLDLETILKYSMSKLPILQHLDDVDHRFVSSLKLLITGEPKDAALGILHLLRVPPALVYEGMSQGTAAIQAEFEAYDGEHAEEAKECMRYVLFEAAGSSSIQFHNGARDLGRNGERLADFALHPNCRLSRLEEAHVAAIRIYTTAAYKVLNGPLRNTSRRDGGHPLPVTISFLREAIGKLRAVGAQEDQGAPSTRLDLWRGLRDTKVTTDFLRDGGTEIAPMSTTTNLEVALQYSNSLGSSMIFKLRTESFMQRGASIEFLSAYPGEKEVLYPPLTFLKPTGRELTVSRQGHPFHVIEVTPQFGG